jgi:hypothetical protein
LWYGLTVAQMTYRVMIKDIEFIGCLT